MRISDLPYIMARCLILTIIIEVLVAYLFGYRKKDLVNIMLANIITNPIVVVVPVYFNIKYGILERNIVLYILEILTVIVEGFIYNKYFNKRSMNTYKLSLILNIITYLAGEIINRL